MVGNTISLQSQDSEGYAAVTRDILIVGGTSIFIPRGKFDAFLTEISITIALGYNANP